jgi:hypothetical protein
MRRVEVTWVDAISSGAGWKSKDDVRKRKPAVCKSMGYVLTDEASHITLIAHETDDGDCDGDVTIPRGWIEKVVEL